MKFRSLHRWDVTPKEAVQLQRKLRDRVAIEPTQISKIRTVAAADVSFDKKRPDVAFAALVVCSFPDLQEIARLYAPVRITFPYIPGLLSFREVPPLLKVFGVLQSPICNLKCDVILVDGHGYAHPRRFGAACHLGLSLDIPTVGCAKSVLVGDYREPALNSGSWSPLIHNGETVGRAVRTRVGVAPVFVSVGHRVDLDSATEIVLACVRKFRIPVPQRAAHLLSNQLRLELR